MSVQNSKEILYPSSDGKRMADNTLQFRWIVTIEGNLEAIFRENPNVFVAGDLLWYPVEGLPEICAAPDAMVVFGRPKGDRLSYKQWEEDDIAPQVVFEILSKSNNYLEMAEKMDFYEEYGVEEYYVYDPDHKKLGGWRREGSIFRKIAPMNGWVSPLLKIRFEMKEEMVIYGPDNQPFRSFCDILLFQQEQQKQLEEQRKWTEQEKQRAEQAEAKYQHLLERLRSKGIDLNGASDSLTKE